jgi:hypothetical protein
MEVDMMQSLLDFYGEVKTENMVLTDFKRYGNGEMCLIAKKKGFVWDIPLER